MAAFELFSFWTVLAFGFVLGIRHAFEADHIAAVTTIVLNDKGGLKKHSTIGVMWGLGHSIALMLVGLAVLLFGLSITPAVSGVFELIVGIVLVGLGFVTMRNFLDKSFHMHVHMHGKAKHTHMHSHRETSDHMHQHKPLMMGMLHGLAGGGALMLIVLVAVNSLVEGILYIILFGIGSILGMLAVTSILSATLNSTAARARNFGEKVKVIAGIVSIFLGFMIITGVFLAG
ncbi:MAG: sulfite exporter TauE/SafE family protein [Candidatus Aenigmarchaeota archaeon]|nr:sulfite exporter TauE/SafE family protein [Candidatus Aenigmarchaeota archaeon]